MHLHHHRTRDWIATLMVGVMLASTLVISMATAAGAQTAETPEEEDVVDQIFALLTAPDILILLVDPGQVNDSLEVLIPQITDEWPVISVGSEGCLLTTGGPSKSADGFRVKGNSRWSCTQPQAEMYVSACIQVKGANRWKFVEGSCRSREGINDDVLTKRTSAFCRPGTWKYRIAGVGSATSFGGGKSLATQKSSPLSIFCKPA